MPGPSRKTHGATWNLVRDDDRTVAADYGVRAIPQTFFIAPDGRITQRYFASPPDLADVRRRDREDPPGAVTERVTTGASPTYSSQRK